MPTLLDVRATTLTDAAALALVERFCRGLASGDYKRASTMVSDPVDVFGKMTSRATFAEDTEPHVNDDATVVAIDKNVVTATRQADVFGGPVDAASSIFFASFTLRTARDAVSWGFVVDASRDPLIVRVFDPRPFVEEMAADSPITDGASPRDD